MIWVLGKSWFLRKGKKKKVLADPFKGKGELSP